MQQKNDETRERYVERLQTFVRGQGFTVDSVGPPILAPSAPAHVTIGGNRYASFCSAREAAEAIELWREFWPAIAGKKLAVVTQ